MPYSADVREMTLYVESVRPFMDRCIELKKVKNVHWKTRMSQVKELVIDAIEQFERDYGIRFEKRNLNRVVRIVSEDIGIVKEREWYAR